MIPDMERASRDSCLPKEIRMIVPGPDSRSSDQVKMHICKDITSTIRKPRKQHLCPWKALFDKGDAFSVITHRDPSPPPGVR